MKFDLNAEEIARAIVALEMVADALRRASIHDAKKRAHMQANLALVEKLRARAMPKESGVKS